MNVLLVEPDVILASTYQRTLEGGGHKVQISRTAQRAIYAADAICPDLVILEMQLVSHSGIEFLYEFRSYPEWQDIPVMVLSVVPPAEFQGSWEILHNELGVRAYHYKPRTSLAKLQSLVREFVPISS